MLRFAPALCERCGTIFASRLPVNDTQVRAYRAAGGPCPVCGSPGAIPVWVHDLDRVAERLVAEVPEQALTVSGELAERFPTTPAAEGRDDADLGAAVTEVIEGLRARGGPWTHAVRELSAAAPEDRPVRLRTLVWMLRNA